MTNYSNSTIAAVVTPAGTGGVAIIRLSGLMSWQIAKRLSFFKKEWQAGRVYHDWLIDPYDEKILDEVLFIPFKSPLSFTGEDIVEINCHGGHYLTRMVMSLCIKEGAETAAAGEFTKRAFLNGKIDLTQAESILDLIHAQGETLIKVSANNMRCKTVGTLLDQYFLKISRIQADLVASIDFPDEVEEPDRIVLAKRLKDIEKDIENRLKINLNNQILRQGIEIAIIGPPNAGKSSLFNALLSSDRSIVTDIAGTTRDLIKETISLKGIPVTLIDTAGLRETEDQIEFMGVERSWQAIASSEAIIYVIDGCTEFTLKDRDILEKINNKNVLIVKNKMDNSDFKNDLLKNFAPWPVINISAISGKGIDDISEWIDSLPGNITNNSNIEMLLSERQIQRLSSVKAEIGEATKISESFDLPIDLVTVPLTNALFELQGILGKNSVEEVLDSVFKRFCVGK